MLGIRLFKASAWVLIAMAFAHSFGHFQGARTFANPSERADIALVGALRGYVIGEGSGARSMADLYLGFSLMFSLLSLLAGTLVLAALRATAQNRGAAASLAAVFTCGLLAATAVSTVWFILPPTVFLVASSALGLAATVLLRRAQRLPMQ
jgi:hypothetical protein